jgi:hypothetical protein
MSTGQQLLGRHLYDILTPNDPQAMTIGNYSNSVYITFYTSNNPVLTGYNVGLCNNAFTIVNNNYTTRVGINTIVGRTTLDVDGTLSVNNITTFSNVRAINFTNTTLSNINDITFGGYMYRNGKPFIAPWTNVNPTEYIHTDIYTYSNVGIGTAAPIHKLDVNGNIQFSGRLFHSGEEYRESQFRYLKGDALYNNTSNDIQLSNIYYMHNVAIGTNSSNELTKYKFFVKGDTVIDGKLYANDFISYSGAAANAYKEFTLYGINPNYENKTVVTNDVNDLNTVLFEFSIKAGRYLVFMNIPFINKSPFIFVDNQNWADIVLCQTSALGYTKTSPIISKTPLEIRDIGVRNTHPFEFFVQSDNQATFTIAIRGKGHTLEFGGITRDQFNNPYIEIDQLLRVFPIKGVGIDDSFTVKKALQITPIRYQNILTADTSNFVFSTVGNYTALASNVDVFINGMKYIYYNNDRKDYDISYNYNTATQKTTFYLDLSEPAQKDDVIDIAIWPYATADTLYVSGYYYQQNNIYPTQWLNLNYGNGIRYNKDVIVDGNLIVRGNIVGGCNTETFIAGLPTGDLNITCNVVGTLNIIDGAVTLGKIAPNAIDNIRVIDYTIEPSKLNVKNKIFFLGCNYNEVPVSEQEIPRGRGLYVDGDVYIKGGVQATVFQGNTESVADGALTTAKYANRSVTYPKIGYYSISNDLIPPGAIDARTIANNTITASKIAPQAISYYQIATRGISRSNLQPRSITSNEIDNYAININNLNLYQGSIGFGTLQPLEKVHIEGNLLVNGSMYTSTTTTSIGLSTAPIGNIYTLNGIGISSVTIRKATGPSVLGVLGGIEVVDSSGYYVKNNFGDLYTGNIGIGIAKPGGGIDMGYGDLLVRNGKIAIGRTSINTQITIDALTPTDSTLGINRLAVGTNSLVEAVTINNGGLYVNSNGSYMAFRNGKLGVGTTSPQADLHVAGDRILFDNIDTLSQFGNITINNGALYITGDNTVTGLSNANLTYLADTYTNHIFANDSISSIGTNYQPYFNVNTAILSVGPVGSNSIDINLAQSPIFNGDGYTTNNTLFAGQNVYIISPPLQVSGNTYVAGNMNFNNFFPYRNFVINGGMNISQRYPGGTTNTISQLITNPYTYTLDRHETILSNTTGTLVVNQSNISGVNYFAAKVGVASTTTSTNAICSIFSHKLENLYVNDLSWGTQLPSAITVSFDAISTITHNYTLAIHNADRTRSFLRNVYIPASTTPSRYSYIIPGDSEGNWRRNTISDIGIIVSLNTGIGTTYTSNLENKWIAGTYYARSNINQFMSSANNTLCITNVQVEAGYLSTVFERRPIPVELDLCKRYYEKSYNINVLPGTPTDVGMQYVTIPYSSTPNDWISGTVPFKIPKRNSTWNGLYYNHIGNVNTSLSSRLTSANYITAAWPPNAMASNYHPFALRSENNFDFFMYYSTPQGVGRNIAFHWTANAEL